MRPIAKRLLPLMLLSAAGLCAADAVVGTWVLNPGKSSYSPGPPPKNQTRVYRETPEGITAAVDTVFADGQTAKVQYPVNYDGKEHPVSGSSEIDSILMKRVSNFRAESSLMHAGKVFAKTVRDVSGDGATLTITFEGVGQDGRPIRNVAIYDKR